MAWALLVFARVVEEQACVGVFACGWRGLVFALSGCVRVGVCVLACVRSLGGGGAWFAPPPLPRLACLLACVLTLWRGLVGVCDAPLGAGVTVMGRDNHVPPHAVWRALSPPLRARGERKRVVGARPEW